MSSRKQRFVSPQTASPIRSRSRSQAKPRHLSKPKSSNLAGASTTANAARLTGLEELSQLDNDGMPFILVDGMCTKSRQQLHLALSKCEKRRMKRIQRQCSALPMLKYMKPATRAEPTTSAEKDAKAERDFDEDLKQLCISELTAGENICRDGAVTPIAHAASAENHNTPRLKEICSQLEELRNKQMESPSLCDRPKFMRQGTFDVRREDRLTRTPFSGSKSSCLAESPLGSATDISIGDKSSSLTAPQRQLVRSATMNQPRPKNSCPMLTKNNTSTCLFSDKPSNWLEARKNNRELLLSKIRDPQNSLDTFTNYANSRRNNSTINELTTTSLADDVAAKVSAASIPSKFLKISSRLFKKLKN